MPSNAAHSPIVLREADALRPPRGHALLRGIGPLLIGVAIAAVMQWGVGPFVGTYVARILLDVGIAIILAVSLNIVNGLAGQFSLGHAGFSALGGYAAGSITYYGSLILWNSSVKHGGPFGAGEWLFVAACLTGGLVAAGAGFIVGLPALRLRGDYLAIATLGFGEIVRVMLQQTGDVIYSARALEQATVNDFFPPPLGGSLGFSGIPTYTSLFWVYLFCAVTIVVAQRLKFSAAGRAMVSIREDEIAAQAMGVNITKWKVRAFVISAFFAGVAGALFAHESGVIISPGDAGFQRSIEIVIMVVLGGKGSITGVLLAAAILSTLPEFLRDFAQYRMIIYALLLIGMMLLRPQGLFGNHEIWDYFKRRRKSSS
ncbi:MAG: branched-chain amino acid ABC transporter permease [Planctomycetaceae bacterium]|nr:branched-chain amino acid ABC transporter permease [Planctomycetaceae bacterium]